MPTGKIRRPRSADDVQQDLLRRELIDRGFLRNPFCPPGDECKGAIEPPGSPQTPVGACVAEVGSFTSPSSPTSTQINHSLGVIPKLVLVWGTGGVTGNDSIFTMGASNNLLSQASIALNQQDATSNLDEDRYHNQANILSLPAATGATGGILEQAELASVSTTQFELDWSATLNGTPYFYALLGGAGVNVTVVPFQAPTGGPQTQNIAHGLGAAPSTVMVFSAHNLGAAGTFDQSAETGLTFGGSDTGGADRWSGIYQTNGSGFSTRAQEGVFIAHSQPVSIVERATVQSVDATNVVLNWAQTHSAEWYYLVCLNGCQAQTGKYTSPAAPGIVPVNLSFAPSLYLNWGVMSPAAADVQDTAALFTFGAVDGTNDRSAGVMMDQNVPGQRATRFSSATEVLRAYTAPLTQTEAASAAFSGNDVNVNFTSSDATLREYNYIAFG